MPKLALFSLENQTTATVEHGRAQTRIQVHRDVLRAEARTSSEEAICNLNDRTKQVDILKSRFDAVARGEDEGHSQSYYIIKAAQKREEMQAW